MGTTLCQEFMHGINRAGESGSSANENDCQYRQYCNDQSWRFYPGKWKRRKRKTETETES